MRSSLVVALIALSLLTPACDVVVESDTQLVLGDGSAAFGSGSTNSRSGLPAVRVQPRGTLVVQNANVFGGGTVIDIPSQVFSGMAGAGIFSDGGTVRIMQGLVRGGASVIAVLPENAPPAPDDAGPAILARSSVLQIEGGQLVGGALVPLLARPNLVRPAPAVAIDATDSVVMITGGVVNGGTISDDPNLGGLQSSLVARTSDVEIRGGTFMGAVSTFGSDLDVFGGSFLNGIGVNSFSTTTPQTAGRARIFGGRLSLSVGSCVEVHGGQILGLLSSSLTGRVLIFGTNLRSESQTLPRNTVRITGTLEDGTPIDTMGSGLVSFGLFFEFRAPGGEGCPAS